MTILKDCSGVTIYCCKDERGKMLIIDYLDDELSYKFDDDKEIETFINLLLELKTNKNE
jgi:hypothetical protein